MGGFLQEPVDLRRVAFRARGELEENLSVEVIQTGIFRMMFKTFLDRQLGFLEPTGSDNNPGSVLVCTEMRGIQLERALECCTRFLVFLQFEEREYSFRHHQSPHHKVYRLQDEP